MKQDIFQKLGEYFNTTPKEQIDQGWNSIKDFDTVGPTLEEYFETTKEVYEEVLTKTYSCQEIINTLLTKHPFIAGNKEAMQCVDRSIEALQDLYNFINIKYVHS